MYRRHSFRMMFEDTYREGNRRVRCEDTYVQKTVFSHYECPEMSSTRLYCCMALVL
jgi:hypothetical protein